jgi:hypothetical protein
MLAEAWQPVLEALPSGFYDLLVQYVKMNNVLLFKVLSGKRSLAKHYA